MQNTLKRLTILIAVLAGVAGFGGLMIPNLYRDNAFYRAAWQANDLITILLTPMLLLAYHYYRAGSARAQLVWLGLLLYMFYNYAFYLFGAVFNWFFLIYAAVFTLSLYALLLGLSEINGSEVRNKYLEPRKRKVIVTFLVLVAIPLAWVEVAQCWKFILSGTPPEIPSLVMALDLTLVIPNTVLAALLLAAKRPWGVIVSAMMLVKSFTYGLVLVSSTTFIAIAGVGPWDPLLPFYIFVSGGGFVFLAILLKDVALEQHE
jgi:hypothetical protein